MVKKRSKFRISWILNGQLALGPAPQREQHLDLLKEDRICSILSLCGIEEAPHFPRLEKDFTRKRCVLPDHKYEKSMSYDDFELALKSLEELILDYQPVYVHCVAAVERSPLLCMGWLIKKHGLSSASALEYVSEIHKGTNPLPEQLKVLDEILRI